MRYHHTPVRMTKITQETTGVGTDVENRKLSCTVGGNANWCSHSGNIMEVPQEVKNKTTLQSSNCPTRF